MSKLLISDTCEAVVRRKSDGKVFVTSDTQLASISTTLGINEKIYGSIGNKPLAIMRGQKEVTSTLRNAFYNQEIISMTQGVSIQEDGTAEVDKREEGLKVTNNADTLEVNVEGNPIGGTVHVTNEEGETEETTVSNQTVEIPTDFAKEGDIVSVTYKEEVTGDVVELNSEAFSEAHEITYRTVGYNPSTNRIVKDIFIKLNHVIPSGDLELSFENGTAIAPEITFDAMAAPNSSKIGEIIEVART